MRTNLSGTNISASGPTTAGGSSPGDQIHNLTCKEIRELAEIRELERRLKDAIRAMRNEEEHSRQVMLELLRVRDEQEVTQKIADATAAQAALADQQREEMRAALRKSELACLEMEQTPGWWLIKSFHGRMKRSPMLAATIGLAVKAARSLRLLPRGCTEEARRIAPLVDEDYYFRSYPEARAWGVPAAEHYFRLGASKGYNPSPLFNTEFYLRRYPDVASADLNPLLHYVDIGAGEGRLTHAVPEEAPGGKPLTTPANSPLTMQIDPALGAPSVECIKLPERSTVRPHRETVNIIVTVHNALEHVRGCLSSILEHTCPPYDLVLVDDGSDPPTSEYLRRFASEHRAMLIRNDAAKGYTFAANQGLRAARGEYVLLLNSDTIVTDNWLDRMVMCAESGPRVGIVGPLSNSANWQSIPEAMEDGKWAANELPENWTVRDMARAVAASTGRTYPRIPFLNGFCLLIKRQVLDGVGYFDEVNFGRGYGEESDYCLRAHAKGWVLCVADDAYVHHAQTKSYPPERRDRLSEVSHRMLYTKHKKALIDRSGEQVRDDLVLLGIRARAGQMFARHNLIEEGRRRWQGKRIAFVLPIREQCGVDNAVLAEAQAMQAFGADVLIANLLEEVQEFRSAYPKLEGYDAVVATDSHSVSAIRDCALGARPPRIGYYIREPFPSGAAEYHTALSACSLIPGMIRFTSTAWNRDQVLREAGVDSVMVGPCCDLDLFRPRVVPSNGKLNVSASIRPSSPHCAARETMEVLALVDRQYGDRVAIHLFGVDSRDPLFLDLPRDFQWTNHGLLTQERMAALLSAQDIFVDLSRHQAMDPIAMEAMASGAAAFLPQTGGYGDFVVPGENALVVDTSNPSACLQAIGRLIDDSDLLAKIRSRAQADVVRFWPEQAAFNILNAFFSESTQAPEVPPRVAAHV